MLVCIVTSCSSSPEKVEGYSTITATFKVVDSSGNPRNVLHALTAEEKLDMEHLSNLSLTDTVTIEMPSGLTAYQIAYTLDVFGYNGSIYLPFYAFIEGSTVYVDGELFTGNFDALIGVIPKSNVTFITEGGV